MIKAFFKSYRESELLHLTLVKFICLSSLQNQKCIIHLQIIAIFNFPKQKGKLSEFQFQPEQCFFRLYLMGN